MSHGRSHRLVHLVAAWADVWPDGGDEGQRLTADRLRQRTHGGPGDASCASAPSRVHDRHPRAVDLREQDRNAVRGQDADPLTGGERHERVRLRIGGEGRNLDDACAVNLPGRDQIGDGGLLRTLGPEAVIDPETIHEPGAEERVTHVPAAPEADGDPGAGGTRSAGARRSRDAGSRAPRPTAATPARSIASGPRRRWSRRPADLPRKNRSRSWTGLPRLTT